MWPPSRSVWNKLHFFYFVYIYFFFPALFPSIFCSFTVFKENSNFEWHIFISFSLFPGCAENFILEVVGALPKDVTKEELHQFFRAYYPSVKGAELRLSESLGRYGTVKFGNKHERDLATIQTHMQSFRKRDHGKSQHFFYKDTATGYQRGMCTSNQTS